MVAATEMEQSGQPLNDVTNKDNTAITAAQMERPSVMAATRHVLQRQTTRLGLTSDDSVPSAVLAQSLDDCLDEFLRQFVFPLAAIFLVLFTFIQISSTTGFADKVVGATILTGVMIASVAGAIRSAR